jgi:hypothetical protein
VHWLGVVVALLSVNDNVFNWLKTISAEHGLTQVLGAGGYSLLGVAFFVAMGTMLYRIGIKKD